MPDPAPNTPGEGVNDEQSHTPEPWCEKYSENWPFGGAIFGGDGFPVVALTLPSSSTDDRTLADALCRDRRNREALINLRRIRVAINAFAGIPTETLERAAAMPDDASRYAFLATVFLQLVPDESAMTAAAAIAEVQAPPSIKRQVEIWGPDLTIHYRRPENHPDCIEAMNLPGYTVMHSDGLPFRAEQITNPDAIRPSKFTVGLWEMDKDTVRGGRLVIFANRFTKSAAVKIARGMRAPGRMPVLIYPHRIGQQARWTRFVGRPAPDPDGRNDRDD